MPFGGHCPCSQNQELGGSEAAPPGALGQDLSRRQLGLPRDIGQQVDIVLVPQLAFWCYWHLLGRGQGCCQTAYNARPASHSKEFSAPNAAPAKARNRASKAGKPQQ